MRVRDLNVSLLKAREVTIVLHEVTELVLFVSGAYMLQAAMARAVYETITWLLLLLTTVRSTSVQPKKIIYIDKVNGTLEPSF